MALRVSGSGLATRKLLLMTARACVQPMGRLKKCIRKCDECYVKALTMSIVWSRWRNVILEAEVNEKRRQIEALDTAKSAHK